MFMALYSRGEHLISSDRQHLSYYDVCLEVSENASMAFFAPCTNILTYLLTYVINVVNICSWHAPPVDSI